MSIQIHTVKRRVAVNRPSNNFLENGHLDPYHEAEAAVSRGESLHYYAGILKAATGATGTVAWVTEGADNWDYPSPAVETIALLLDLNFQEKQMQDGVNTIGSAKARIEPLLYQPELRGRVNSYHELFRENPVYHQVQRGDLFIAPRWVRRFTDVLQRGVRDFIRNFGIQAVRRVFVGATEYFFGDDWLLDVNDPRKVVWQAGRGPAVKAHYSVEYESAVNFIVYDDVPPVSGGIAERIARRVPLQVRQFDHAGELREAPQIMNTKRLGY